MPVSGRPAGEEPIWGNLAHRNGHEESPEGSPPSPPPSRQRKTKFAAQNGGERRPQEAFWRRLSRLGNREAMDPAGGSSQPGRRPRSPRYSPRSEERPEESKAAKTAAQTSTPRTTAWRKAQLKVRRGEGKSRRVSRRPRPREKVRRRPQPDRPLSEPENQRPTRSGARVCATKALKAQEEAKDKIFVL